MSLAVHAFLAANSRMEEGYANAEAEKRQHLRVIQSRYWRSFFLLLSANLTRNGNQLDFSDDERLFVDLGVVDIRMLGGDRDEKAGLLLDELKATGPSFSYYFSEWLWHRFQQFQLEDSVADVAAADGSPVSQLGEARKRVLNRLSGYFDGLPGIPRELSEAMRSGELDNAILSLSVGLMRRSNRTLLLRRRNLWQLRDQVISKARARVESQSAHRLFEALGEIYASEWREHYEAYLRDSEPTETGESLTAVSSPSSRDSSIGFTNSGLVMLEARQMRMRLVLASAVNGDPSPDIVLSSDAPRLTKADIAKFAPLLRSFDRSMIELPPIVILPGLGRGYFAWENGCILLSVRPSVSPDDSLATAFAFQRMFDDKLNKDGSLRKAYEKAFPGSDFRNEFPVDYRAWLCRLTHGDKAAMTPERRTFFREHIGPDLSGPLLPVNLRNIGPQARDIISRRLEKQIAAGEKDFKLHRRLGCIYWHQENMAAAAVQFTAAMQLAPNDGETMFITGMFLRAQDDADGANEVFRYGAERSTDTLWGVYCQDALANMF